MRVYKSSLDENHYPTAISAINSVAAKLLKRAPDVPMAQALKWKFRIMQYDIGSPNKTDIINMLNHVRPDTLDDEDERCKATVAGQVWLESDDNGGFIAVSRRMDKFSKVVVETVG